MRWCCWSRRERVFGLIRTHATRTPRSTNDCLALFGRNRGQLHFQPPGECKNNIRSDHGNTTDIDYPNTLGFRPSTSDNNPTLSDNIRNIRQVLGIGLLGLGSPVMSTARRSYTPPTPPHSIIPAWSALDFVSISFPFVYFIYNAVNFILCSLSDVC
jgi:hypothetical protein